MDAEFADELEEDLANAEAELSKLRTALDEAREATKTAEDKFLKRQAEEAETRTSYGQAVERVQESYAKERQRLEDEKRQTDERLRDLEMRVKILSDGPSETSAIDPGSARSEMLEEKFAALVAPDKSGSSASAYEDDWYRTLRKRSEDDLAVEGVVHNAE